MNPITDEVDGKFRLYSQFKFEFDCNGECISLKKVKIKKAGGDELWQLGIIFGTMNLDKVKINEAGGSVVKFEWRGYGRPNKIAEPSFQLFKGRIAKNIWHRVKGRIYCIGEKGYIEATVSGSSFPSHKLWLNGELKMLLNQGDIDDLWQSADGNAEFVR